MLKAAILAGGRGVRLRPLTDNTPKPMIKINGKPFLHHQLELLKKNGITEILLCVGYLKDTIVDYFGDGAKLGLKIEYSVEEGFLGTGGALKLAAEQLPGDFILIYGDSYLPIDYGQLLERWQGLSANALVVCYDNAAAIARNNICLEPDGKISAYNKRAPLSAKANFVEAGVSVVRNDVLKIIPRGKAVSLEEDIFPFLIKAGLLQGYPTSQRYYDIGTPERLREIEKVLT